MDAHRDGRAAGGSLKSIVADACGLSSPKETRRCSTLGESSLGLVGRRFSVQVLEHVYSNLVVLEPTERLTVETEVDLKDAVRRQLDAGRRHLVLDMARVPVRGQLWPWHDGASIRFCAPRRRMGEAPERHAARASPADDHASVERLRVPSARNAGRGGIAPALHAIGIRAPLFHVSLDRVRR